MLMNKSAKFFQGSPEVFILPFENIHQIESENISSRKEFDKKP